jgi:thioesterase domain-containing protein/acyl carrier protein
MIPSTLVPLETIPLNANGKVDRRALATLREDPIATGDAGKFDIETLTDVESTLIDIWKELLRRERVSVDDNFFELGGHSLLATRMTSRVRDVFGRELPLKSVFETPTIAGLARILRSSRDLEALDPYPPLVPLDRSAYRRGLPSRTVQEFRLTVGSPLVLLSRGGNREPFFCVSPMFGVVFPYVELARHLGGDRPFYGLQAVGLNDGSPPLDSIEAIAARYVAEIQTLQPRGSYYLGGWSFGGIVAFEMARQLIDTGREVALLAILDTPAPAIENRSTLYGSLKFLFKNAARSILPFLLDFGAILGERAGLADSRFSRWQWFALARLIPEESRARLKDETAIGRILAIVRANLRATYRYAPRPYPDRLALFTAEESSDLFGDDPTLGWDAWAKEIRCHRVPGDHLSLLKQPHVGILARQLEEYLR